MREGQTACATKRGAVPDPYRWLTFVDGLTFVDASGTGVTGRSSAPPCPAGTLVTEVPDPAPVGHGRVLARAVAGGTAEKGQTRCRGGGG